MKNKFGRHALIQIFMVLAVCLFCVCGHVRNEGEKETEVKQAVEIKNEHKYEVEMKDEEDILAVKGKLSAADLTIHSGEALAQMREMYDWDTLSDANYERIVFSEDLAEWRTEDLEALSILKGTVYVESSGKTFPARALTYLTGSETNIFR